MVASMHDHRSAIFSNATVDEFRVDKDGTLAGIISLLTTSVGNLSIKIGIVVSFRHSSAHEYHRVAHAMYAGPVQRRWLGPEESSIAG
jgi:hypothetical protein